MPSSMEYEKFDWLTFCKLVKWEFLLFLFGNFPCFFLQGHPLPTSFPASEKNVEISVQSCLLFVQGKTSFSFTKEKIVEKFL